ncbi:hypothetical protein [Paludibacterium yongneupense]|uniref:hypothetical protein n=1 Tax=Paludibacterium yongneupense TaxID=400061 RepID=UPI00041921C5|nr:hypothetical protein [Paludibacterium yongneupense]
MKTRCQIVAPRRLPAAARSRLARTLYAVHCQIFEGVEFDAFVRCVLDSPAEQSAILLHLNAAGDIVGYCALHLHAPSGLRATVLRLEAGLLRDYRGAGRNAPFVLRHLLWHQLRHPLNRLYFLSTPVHPSSYLSLARLAGLFLPGRDAPLPPLSALSGTLRARFDLQAVSADCPAIIRVGWITRESASERKHWQEHPHPAVRFFLRHNPGYGEGHGLLTMIPVNLGSVVRAGLRFAWHKLVRLGQGFTPADADR